MEQNYEDLEKEWIIKTIDEIEANPSLMVFGFCRAIVKFAKELAVIYLEDNKISVDTKLNIIRDYCRMIEEKQKLK